MKRAKSHMVPLSDAALAVLAKADALRLEGTDVVFPGVAGNAMSDMTLLKVLRDMSEPFHVHVGSDPPSLTGPRMRALPTPWWRQHWAHKTPDAVQAAYRRTTYLGAPGQPGARVKLMEAWSRYCSGKVGSDGSCASSG